MPRYEVEIPFAGYFNAIAEADSPEEAIAKVMETTRGTVTLEGECSPEIVEWDFFGHLVRGNVFYGQRSHAEAQEIEGDD